MNSGFFQGLVMNRVYIESAKTDKIYMLIRERLDHSTGIPNYVPAIFFVNNKKKMTKYILEKIHPGCVVGISYGLKTMNIKIPTPSAKIEYEVKKQSFMVIKSIELFYVLMDENSFQPVEELVDIMEDTLLSTVAQEDAAEIENLLTKKIEKIADGKV